MYKIYGKNTDKKILYWLVDEELMTITRFENGKESKTLLNEKDTRMIIRLIDAAPRPVGYEKLYLACNSDDLGERTADFSRSMITRFNRISNKDSELHSLIENGGKSYYIPATVKIEKISTSDSEKSEEVLLNEFEETLMESTKSHILLWELKNYEIEENLLPTYESMSKTLESLYDFLHIELKQSEMHNWILESPGGSGKTSSLIHVCKKLLEEDNRDKIIPIFIRIRDVDSNVNNPLCNYLYQHFANFTNPESIYNPEKIFLHDLEKYLRDNKNAKKLLVILDGCNEGDEKCLDDLHLISELPNTMVVLSTRIHSKIFDDYRRIKINALGNDTVIKYLEEHGITLEKSYDSKNLRLPIYLQMYTNVCIEKKDNVPTMSISSQAGIINEWVKSTYKKFRDDDLEFSLELFLPLLSLLVYCNKTHERHNELHIDRLQRKEAYKKLIEIFKDSEFAYSAKEEGYDVSKIDVNKCIDLFEDIVVKKLAFYQNEEAKCGVFFWSHECYRDWFVAKGLYVLYLYSEELFIQYFEILMTQKFVYPKVLQKHRDYPSFAVGVYLAELLGEEKLTTEKNSLYEIFLRNIAFIYEDIGDPVNTILYGKYIERRHNDNEIKTPILQKCITMSGLAYSYLHFFNLENRKDSNDLIESAQRMLEEAEQNMSQIVTVKYNYDISDEKLLKLKPDELLSYFESNWTLNYDLVDDVEFDINDSSAEWKNNHMVLERSYIENKLKYFDEIDYEDIKHYQEKLCPLLAKIYGNYGSYYLNQYRSVHDKKYIVEAHKNHLIGAAYKYLILKNYEPGTEKYRNASNSFAVSMRSFAVDMYVMNDYELSLQYYDYALKYCISSEYIRTVTRAYIIRSKIWHMLTDYEKIGSDFYDMSEMIKEESELLNYFKENYLFGEIDRMVCVVAEIITLYRIDDVNNECYEKLVALINKIEDVYREYFIADNSCFRLREYLDNGGENIWRNNSYE